MNSPSYRISNKAIQDLEDIWFYSSNKWSQEQADRYYNSLIEEFTFLAKHPKIGRKADEIKEGYRIDLFKSHLILYTQLEDRIQIVRILHHSMDIKKQLR
jgi:toxin ParE1/3/4